MKYSPLYKMLVALGFKRKTLIRHQDGWCAIYERNDHDRLIDVQIWQREPHRVSHMKRTKRGGLSGTTEPTDFRTPLQMLSAIERERNR